MPSNKYETEIIQLKNSLEKAMSDESSSHDSIKDMLNALHKVEISVDLLKTTKIGQTIQDVKKKYAGEELSNQAKALITKWKRDCEIAAAASKKADNSSASNLNDDKKNSSSKTLASPSADNDDISEEHFNQLPPMRKTVLQMKLIF